MRIEALRQYQRRGGDGFYFRELSPSAREAARQWLRRFVDRYRRRNNGRPVPGWVFAIYVGQAKRLALHPPTSAWGRSMLAKRGGHAVQWRYRLEGRHPTEKATRVRELRRKALSRQQTPRRAEQESDYYRSVWPKLES